MFQHGPILSLFVDLKIVQIYPKVNIKFETNCLIPLPWEFNLCYNIRPEDNEAKHCKVETNGNIEYEIGAS